MPIDLTPEEVKLLIEGLEARGNELMRAQMRFGADHPGKAEIDAEVSARRARCLKLADKLREAKP